MRPNLDANNLSPHRHEAPSSGRTSSGAAFRQILQQQPLNWGSSYESSTQAAPKAVATTPSAPATASTAFSNFGSTPNSSDPTGGQTYNPMSNPLLTPQISSTDLNGTVVTQNTCPTATASAAQQFAQVLGGTVVKVQTSWSTTNPVYAIELPSGQRIDATAIANILGNNAAYPGAAIKGGEIAKLMGAAYTPSIADIARQMAGGANANLLPVAPVT